MTEPVDVKRYLVLCTGNRCRSQMAHGWLEHLGGEAVVVDSAGTEPKGVHPVAVEVMKEAGIDIGDNTSDHVDDYAGNEYDVVITVCDDARDACPTFPNAGRTVHQPFRDPDGQGEDVFREVRDEIAVWAREFLAGEGAGVIRDSFTGGGS